MSSVSEVAAVRILIADHVSVDGASGKASLLGYGIAFIGLDERSGLTAPFGLLVAAAVPPTHYDTQCNAIVSLGDSGGAAVMMPASDGHRQPFIIQQTLKFSRPIPQTGEAPIAFVPSRALLGVTFLPGLPLVAGQGYRWRLTLDDETRNEWTEAFAVVAQGAIVDSPGPGTPRLVL